MGEERKVKVYGPSIGWTLLFLGPIFGTIFVSVYYWLDGEINLGGMFFFVTVAVIGALIFTFAVAKYYYITERGITVKILGALKVGAWAWDHLEGTRGTIMRGRSGPTNATARVTRVYHKNGRVAFSFNFFTANFGGLHNDVFHHIRMAKKASKAGKE